MALISRVTERTDGESGKGAIASSRVRAVHAPLEHFPARREQKYLLQCSKMSILTDYALREANK